LALCAVAALSADVSFGFPPTIGVASAIGTFFVNSVEVAGNSNLLDGAQIKTSKASSQLFMQNGASLILGIDSGGTIYRDHLVLEEGATRITNMRGFSVNAGDYRVAAAEPESQVVVRLDGGDVQVAALAGSVNVFSGEALLTRIGAGTASAFQNGGSGGNTKSGTPRKNNNNVTRRNAAFLLLTAAGLAGLGLLISSIVQPGPTSP
jgi:hypothetical protein